VVSWLWTLCIFLVLCGDWLWALGSADGIAQERASDVPPEMSGEAWRAPVKASPERLDTMRREHLTFAPHAPTPDELAEQASRSIREDASLMPGDVASTDQGLFRFQSSPLKGAPTG
jgi:hypothetical protein